MNAIANSIPRMQTPRATRVFLLPIHSVFAFNNSGGENAPNAVTHKSIKPNHNPEVALYADLMSAGSQKSNATPVSTTNRAIALVKI